MPEHYFLPKTKIFFTVIPKTGCTSLKNYLFDLESSSEIIGSQKASAEYLEMTIHSAKLLSQYRVRGMTSSKIRQGIKVLVLRSPYTRALSAWVNKFLYAQHDFSIFSLYKDKPFTPVDFESIRELNGAFEAFLRELLENEEFLASDPHWRPQSSFVSDPADYEIVVETRNLETLPLSLSNLPRFSGLPELRPFPILNSSRPNLIQHLGSDSAWNLVEQIYSQDFELLRRAGLGVPDRPPIPAPLGGEEKELIKAEKMMIQTARAVSENSLLNTRLEFLLESRSWRWTRVFRVLGSILDKR